MPAESSFALLQSEDILMIFVRCMEVFNFLIFALTVRIIHNHSSRSLGAYKYCLYQIIFWPLLSQQCTLLGPIFTFPIIGAYHYIDFTDNPAVIHGLVSAWILISAFDLEAILDGFNYRFRVLLLTFHPRLATLRIWIPATMNAKVVAVLLVGWWIAPVGRHLHKDDMRLYLIENFPDVVAKFEAYKSVVVYDVRRVTGFRDSMIALTTGTAFLCCWGVFIICAIRKVLHMHRNKMSLATQRMHKRFLFQLGLQASIPFLVLVCPLSAILTLILAEFEFETNFFGYVILFSLMLHGPLASIMTIALYDPYRKVVVQFFQRKIVCRTGSGIIPVGHSNVISTVANEHGRA